MGVLKRLLFYLEGIMKEIIKLFKEFQYKYTLWDVFSDFLELSAISISNSIIKDKAKENRYFQIIKKTIFIH